MDSVRNMSQQIKSDSQHVITTFKYNNREIVSKLQQKLY
jgi:hypothetical protein